MINSHIHTFTEKDVPRNFLPLGLVRVLSSKVGYFLFARILKNLNPFSSKDEFDRYCKFIEIGKHKTQEEILDECAENYPHGTKFIVLPMDMAFMEAGKVPRAYEDQLSELTTLSQHNPNVLPFIHLDPRRPNFEELFFDSIKKGFKGVKLYPPLGYFPYDSRFRMVFTACEEKGIPILAHCTAGNPVHFKGSEKELIGLLRDCKLPIDWNQSKKQLCAYFTHPEGYKYVFSAYPKLKVCLAHFGRENDWDQIIRDMMEIYPTLYTDISYSLYKEEHWAYLKVLLSTNPKFRERCLFGSDWYMNAVEGQEKQFSIKLRGYLGEDLWTQIAEVNPKRFLNLT